MYIAVQDDRQPFGSVTPRFATDPDRRSSPTSQAPSRPSATSITSRGEPNNYQHPGSSANQHGYAQLNEGTRLGSSMDNCSTAPAPLSATPGSMSPMAAASSDSITSPKLRRPSQPVHASPDGSSSRNRGPVLKRHGSVDSELGPVRGLEKSRRSRRQRLGMFPSMTDLVAFAGAATQNVEPAAASAPVTFNGVRRTKSLHECLDSLSLSTDNGGTDPWQQFAKWREQNPGAPRSDARAFIERKLAQPKE